MFSPLVRHWNATPATRPPSSTGPPLLPLLIAASTFFCCFLGGVLFCCGGFVVCVRRESDSATTHTATHKTHTQQQQHSTATWIASSEVRPCEYMERSIRETTPLVTHTLSPPVGKPTTITSCLFSCWVCCVFCVCWVVFVGFCDDDEPGVCVCVRVSVCCVLFVSSCGQRQTPCAVGRARARWCGISATARGVRACAPGNAWHVQHRAHVCTPREVAKAKKRDHTQQHAAATRRPRPLPPPPARRLRARERDAAAEALDGGPAPLARTASCSTRSTSRSNQGSAPPPPPAAAHTRTTHEKTTTTQLSNHQPPPTKPNPTPPVLPGSRTSCIAGRPPIESGSTVPQNASSSTVSTARSHSWPVASTCAANFCALPCLRTLTATFCFCLCFFGLI